MLAGGYHWINWSDGTRLLRFNMMTVAIIRPSLDVTILWQGRTARGRAPDVERAIAGVESWVKARNGELPAIRRRR